MPKTTWRDVEDAVDIELGGRTWHVEKIKRSGKTATVKVSRKGQTAKSVVKLKDRVTIVPVQDKTGAQNRWATKAELAESMSRGIPAGDPKVIKPPEKPAGDLWETPQGKTEKLLSSLLQARLVGESKDEAAGYYVPPVNVSTIAAHLAIFHDGAGLELDEASQLAQHKTWHEAAAARELALPVNHWHTAKRP